MSSKTLCPFVFPFLFFFFFSPLSAQHFPGGVPGAEVWYMSDHQDLQNGEYNDYSSNDVRIEPCDEGHDSHEALFNFNPSISAESLCLQYTAPLEQSVNRSMFIVTEPKDNQNPYPHVGTGFNDFVPAAYQDMAYLDSLSRNTFIIETQQGYASRMVSDFAQHQNAHVHFYNWSDYDSDKLFKSYGQLGETDFFIGRKLPHPDLDHGPYFSGLLPEYIAFDRQLTENERNRVESYLALKYGITKWNTEHYQNAKNKIFWKQKNNNLFGNNIFGIGRDDISGLHQLQCESAHARDFLVAGAYQIMTTNAEAQGNFEVDNNEFLVFGDTGESGIGDLDNQNLRRLNKVWLAQVTGDKIQEVPIHFRIDLAKAFEDDPALVDQVVNEELVAWMLHDPYVNNSFVSSFDNGNIDYYKPFDIEFGPGGEVYAHFGADEIFFDRDQSFYDQYTFAIGPECLAQFRPRYDCEEAAEATLECYELDIILTGQCEGEVEFMTKEGEEHLDVWFNEEQTEINGEPTYTVYICAPEIYTAIINIGSGTFEYEYEAEPIGPYIVELGPSVQYLSAQQPEILFDAGQYMNDPQATYQWFYNGDQIPYTDSTLTADQPGNYCVIVTTSDRVCVIERCVKVLTKLAAQVNCQSGFCDLSANQIHITILDGASPYQTVVEGQDGTETVYIHQGNTVIDGLAEGYYIITVTDSLGAEYQVSCGFDAEFQMSENFNVVNPVLSLTNQQIELDASPFWGGPSNFEYQWYMDDNLMSQDNNAQLIVETPGEYTVEVYFPDFDCYGYATQIITSVLQGSISQSGDCDEFTNTLEVQIDFGFANYTTVIIGTQYPSGDPFSLTPPPHSGDISLSGIPYGSYTVTVTDHYLNTMQQQVEFVGLQLDIHDQLIDICQNQCGSGCGFQEDACGQGIPLMVNGIGTTCASFLLDASLLINGSQNVSYEWFMYGSSLGIYSPEITFETGGQCYIENPDFDPQYACDGTLPIYTVVITDNITDCSISQSFALRGWCPVLDPPPLRITYTTKAYPNPSDSDVTFYYAISTTGQEAFNGTVEVFSMLGALIYRNSIQGQSAYTLPYRLVASGAYIIRTTTDDGTVTVDRVIIK